MIIINYLLILFVGIVLGGLLKNWSNKLSEKIANNKLILDKKDNLYNVVSIHLCYMIYVL